MKRFTSLIIIVLSFLTFPFYTFADLTCRYNGEIVQCPNWLESNFWVIFASMFIFFILLFVFFTIAFWKIFKKANKPGWAAIVPIYNLVIIFRIANLSPWLIILLCIPLVNIVVYIVLANSISKSFGKEIGFTIGLFLLPYIFYPILAFGKATYNPTVK